MIYASIYILKAGIRGGDETIARSSTVSILKDMQCPSELPSIDDVDQYLRLLKLDSDPVANHTYYMAKLADVDRSASLFLSDGRLIASGRRLFRTGKDILGFGPVSCQHNDEI